jgi:NAD+ kinase
MGVDSLKYTVLHKKNQESILLKDQLMEKINGDYDEINPDIVFTIGGDGTVLNAVAKYSHLLDHVLFVSIHTGNLGFYTEFLPQELDDILNLLNTNYQINEFSLLSYKAGAYEGLAMNEVFVSGKFKMLEANVYIDDNLIMTTRGNGICISTPTGSTAYNYALGGAIIDHDIKAVQLTLSAPFETVKHRMAYPIVLSEKHAFIIEPKNYDCELSADRLHLDLHNVTKIHVRISNKTARFLKNVENQFAKRIKETFITND